MAEKKKPAEPQAPTSFPVLLGEFAGGIKKVESRAAFVATMNAEGLAAGRRQPEQWKHFYQLFLSKPVGVSWGSWAAKNGGN